MRLKVAKILLQKPDTYFNPSGLCLGVYSPGIIPQKAFVFPALLETQERYLFPFYQEGHLLPVRKYTQLLDMPLLLRSQLAI